MHMSPRGAAKSGFTLVEILVVVVIITILASLITAVAFQAIVSANRMRILTELNNIQQGIETFKLKYDYPPDCSDPAVVTRFFQTHFRNRNAATDKLDKDNNGTDDLLQAGKITPDEALVLFLSGFSPDPTRPMTGAGAREPFFEFNETRLTDRDNDGYKEYVPQGGENCPFFYFDARSYTITVAGYQPAGTQGRVAPYKSDLATQVYVEPTKYQIISAGLDGNYGNPAANSTRSFPGGTAYMTGDRDNLTSFFAGELWDARP